MWMVLPRGVFNYDATIWTVVVHAVFVVIESVAACFVARSFFDNVIGLERIVEHRTRDMTRLLDNVAQGVISVDFDGVLGTERSCALATWFGEPPDRCATLGLLVRAHRRARVDAVRIRESARARDAVRGHR